MVDPLALLPRELLRERAQELIAEACAWSVGLSDTSHHLRKGSRVVASGETLGERAEAGLPLASDEDGRLDLADASPGTFQDALNALTADGSLHAARLGQEVLEPFVRETCGRALEVARRLHPHAYGDLVDDVGSDDPADLIAEAEWEQPLLTDAEELVVAALGSVPLVEVEAEGVPLALVRAAEAELRRAAPAPRGGRNGLEHGRGPGGGEQDRGLHDAEPHDGEPDADLAGAVFLAERALSSTGLATPVEPHDADRLLAVLQSEGIDETEVTRVLACLPVRPDTAREVGRLLEARDR